LTRTRSRTISSPKPEEATKERDPNLVDTEHNISKSETFETVPTNKQTYSYTNIERNPYKTQKDTIELEEADEDSITETNPEHSLSTEFPDTLTETFILISKNTETPFKLNTETFTDISNETVSEDNVDIKTQDSGLIFKETSEKDVQLQDSSKQDTANSRLTKPNANEASKTKSSVVYAARPFQFSRRGSSTSTFAPATSREPVKEVSARNQFAISRQRNNPQNTLTQKANEVNGIFEHLDDSFTKPALRNSIQKLYTDNELAQSTLSYKTVNFQRPEDNFEWKEPTYRVQSPPGSRGSIRYRPLGDTNDGRYTNKADAKDIRSAQSFIDFSPNRVSQQTSENNRNYSNEKFDSIPLSTSLEDNQSSHEQSVEQTFGNQNRRPDLVTRKPPITENPTERYLLTLARKISVAINSTESSVAKAISDSKNNLLSSYSRPNKLSTEKIGKSLRTEIDTSPNHINFAEKTTLAITDTTTEATIPLSVDVQFINDLVTLKDEHLSETTVSELDTTEISSFSTPITQSSVTKRPTNQINRFSRPTTEQSPVVELDTTENSSFSTTITQPSVTQRFRNRINRFSRPTTEQSTVVESTTSNVYINFRGRQRTTENKITSVSTDEESDITVSTTEGNQRDEYSRKITGNQRQNLNQLRRPFLQKTEETPTISDYKRTQANTTLPNRFTFVKRNEATSSTLETDKKYTSEIDKSTEAITDELTRRSLPNFQSRRPFTFTTLLTTTTTEESTTVGNSVHESDVHSEKSSTQTPEESFTEYNEDDNQLTTVASVNEKITMIPYQEELNQPTPVSADSFKTSAKLDNDNANNLDKSLSKFSKIRGTTRFANSLKKNDILTSTGSRGLRRRVVVKKLTTTTIAVSDAELKSSSSTPTPKTPLFQSLRQLTPTKTVQDNYITTKNTENQKDIEPNTRRPLFARPKITPNGNSNALKNEQVLLLTRPTRLYGRPVSTERQKQFVSQKTEQETLVNTTADQIFFSQDNVAGILLNETSQIPYSDLKETNDRTNKTRRRKLIRKKIIIHNVDENDNNSTYSENVVLEEPESDRNISKTTKRFRKVVRRLQPIDRRLNDTREKEDPPIEKIQTEALSVSPTPSYRKKIVRKLQSKSTSYSETTSVTESLTQRRVTSRPRTIDNGRQLQTSRTPIRSRIRITTQEPEPSDNTESDETENEQFEKKPKSISNAKLDNNLYTRKPGIYKSQSTNNNEESGDDDRSEDENPVIRKPLYTRKPPVTVARTTIRSTTTEESIDDSSVADSDENDDSGESEQDENNDKKAKNEPLNLNFSTKRPLISVQTRPLDPKATNSDDKNSDEDGEEDEDNDNEEDDDDDDEDDEDNDSKSEEDKSAVIVTPSRNFQKPANRPSYKPNFNANKPIFSNQKIQNIPNRVTFKRPSVRPLLQKPKVTENIENDYDADEISNEVVSKNGFSPRRPSFSRPVTRPRPDIIASQQSITGIVSTRTKNVVRTRTYVRKYSPSTTAPENQLVENLLENINITALNNRNKQIFSKSKDKISNKKKVINSPVSTTQLVVEPNDSEFEPDFDTTTTEDTTDTTDNTVEFYTNKHEINTEVSNPSSNNSQETTTQKPTTLHHIFAIDIDNDSESTTSPVESGEEIVQKLEKLIEINRIEEVYSKSENDSTYLVLEKKPTLSKFGEFSRLTSIKLHKMSAKDTKSLTDSVIHRIKSITSDAAAKNGKSLKFSDDFFHLDNSKLPLENLFDQERHGKQINSGDTKPVPDTVQPPQIILRPEFNETNPLVISIANLDQVILSKVEKKPDSVAMPSAKVNTFVDGPNSGSSQSHVDIQTKSVTSEFNRGTQKRPKASNDQFLSEVNREGVPLLNIKVIPTRNDESDTN
jgi:hypothetical protein